MKTAVTPAKKNSFSSHPRSQARECVFQGLYAFEISKESGAEPFNKILKRFSLDKETKAFACALYRKTLKESEKLRLIIEDFLENWELKRIAILDKLILQIAVCELLFFDDVPPKVSISEAIELAKKYSTDDSSGFVNGILDSVYKQNLKLKEN